MTKKLTLSIDSGLVEFAHQLSKQTNRPISRLFEEYLKRLKNQMDEAPLSERTSRLYGVFNSTPIPDKSKLRQKFHDKSYD
ncbi:MAG TPA: DUF6364 family protein [Bacteroidota bacterium]|nr:DUF6364 family protein [Bacteroidota bacterium]